jgi:hypothetical protein
MRKEKKVAKNQDNFVGIWVEIKFQKEEEISVATASVVVANRSCGVPGNSSDN